MPHVHSVLASAARRERAITRGFLTSKPIGSSHILVPDKIAARVKTISKSLAVHRDHCSLVGRNVHSAAAAAVAAKLSLSPAEFKDALKVHKEANRAKHNWSDLTDDS
jgi:hypothetical protein